MLQNQAINSKGFALQAGNYSMSPQPGVASDMYNINAQMGSPSSLPPTLEKDRSRNGHYETSHRTKDRIRRHERRRHQDEQDVSEMAPNQQSLTPGSYKDSQVQSYMH